MKTKTTLLIIFTLNIISSLIAQPFTKPTFISISNNNFYYGHQVFKPLCINYIINFTYDNIMQDYYISPHYNYSSIWGIPNNSTNGRFCFSASNERESALEKLDNDLSIIDSLGFNVIRLSPTISWQDSNLIPTQTYEEYFLLYDSLLSKIHKHNLHAILVLGADTNCYIHFHQYTEYLNKVSYHFRNNATVMAYVVLAEPFFSWKIQNEQDKIQISNWSRIWYYTIKRNAPKQLITYGIQDPKTLINWDPSALTYDFLSLHLYHPTSNSTLSKNSISSYFKWMNDNYDNIWIIAETGFSGTNDTSHWDNTTGSEEEQLDFADHIMQRSIDCGCKGFSWWQFQDVRWCSSHPYWEEHLGILSYFPTQQQKRITSLFQNFNSRVIQNSNCTHPINYYNLELLQKPNICGYIEDENHNPLKDAVIVAWSSSYKKLYSTFSDTNGLYNLFTEPDSTISLVWISHLGYSSAKFTPQTNKQNKTTIKHLNYNNWVKSWTSDNYPIPSATPLNNSKDTFIVGNFCGDSGEELIVINFSTNNAYMYQFNINHWDMIWYGTIGGWTIRDFDKFYPIDINGDGIDEIFCVQNIDDGWADIYSFNTIKPHPAWLYKWTNSGNGYIGNWRIKKDDIFLIGKFSNIYFDNLLCIDKKNRRTSLLQNFTTCWNTQWQSSSWIGEWYISSIDKYYSGDLDGNGTDELFCIQSTNGNSDWMTLLRFSDSTWLRTWSNNGSSNFGIYPYRKSLYIGNFDSDLSDEILGVDTWATKFDFNTSLSNWNWSWSSYNSKHISDWFINLNDKIFFIKTNPYIPDYLFVLTKNPIYQLNGYFYNP